MQTPEKAPAAATLDTPEKAEPPHVLALAAGGKEVLSKLVGLDQKYLIIEKEYDAEVTKLLAQYEQKYAPLLAARAEKVKALPGFWSAVLQRSEVGEAIEEHDEPVLAALQDIRHESIPNSEDWKLHFHFAENEYFTNSVLTKTYRTTKQNEWSTDLEYTKVESTTIEWKAGKDVTVEKVQAKKVKGGGKKKAKAKAKAEVVAARASFFRAFFRNLGDDCDLPTDVEDSDSDEEEEDDEDKLERFLDRDTEMAEAIKEHVLPHAVRYFTHEAGDDESDEEDEDPCAAATPKTPGQEDEEEDDLSDTPP
jgi:nucleosome assembly protein 1-like 1